MHPSRSSLKAFSRRGLHRDDIVDRIDDGVWSCPVFADTRIFEFSDPRWKEAPPLCAGVPPADDRAVRAGRGPEELAKEFEPSAQAIRNWVAQADRDEGRRADGLTTAEREELNCLRLDPQLKLEREILSKAAAWFARETDVIPPKGSNSSARTGPLTPSP